MPFDPTKPRSRDEVLLQAIVSGDSTAMGDPRDREEEFVKAIADKETLPDYSEASNGDVLQIGSDGPEWGTVPNELPAIGAGDAGKVLKVNAGETGTEWGEAGGGKLYQHFISMRYGSGTSAISIQFTLIASKSTPFTINEIGQYCASIGDQSIGCSGKHQNNGIMAYIRFNTAGTAIQVFYNTFAVSDNTITVSSATGSSLLLSSWVLNSDAVLEIS